MVKEQEIAGNLINSASYNSYKEVLFVDIDGIEVTFPYHNVALASWNDPLPPGAYENYLAMSKLFTPENIPQHWVDFLREIGPEKIAAGNAEPMDLISAIDLISIENPRYKELKIPFIRKGAEENIDLTNREEIIGIVNAVLNDFRLKEDLRKRLVIQEPDISAYFPSNEIIFELLIRLGVKSGIIVDFGCGTGEYTKKWLGHEHTIIGLDRQYHSKWYDKHWKSNDADIRFIRADFMKGLPFPDNSVDLGVMTSVVSQTTENGLAKGLKKIKRVIKEGGILVVGPQDTEDYHSWVILRKEEISGCSEFVEYSVTQLENLLKKENRSG